MKEESLFHVALTKPPAERAAFLDAACAGNARLRADVEALLAAHEASQNPLDQPPHHQLAATQWSSADPLGPATGDPAADPLGPATCDPAAPPNQPSDGAPALAATEIYTGDGQANNVIAGRYTLQERIGEGGMGEVWVAKQTEPVKRKVALKLIKAGMDSRAVLQRFEHERQALAMMDHPNIARVLDGGLTANRCPFFVMELVNGLPLTRFCDEARLTPRERLELFVPICQAVQHAHQKGIVHRDLKPANILVTMIDGRPMPKVIDFGVAKAMGGKLTDESMATQFGAIVGTLEYMAPEQAGFSGQDIDTRADIYSLGVILYELLTGLRPVDASRLKSAAITEMIRVICEEEPSKPSTRLSTDASLPSLAAVRRTDPRKLTTLLRGELDWLIMKCLDKQRDRRYETANALARDIQRYLDDVPVEARPPSFGYRAGKFLRRHRGPVVAAALFLFALIAGVIGTSIGLVQAEYARRDAVAARQAESERAEGELQAKLDAQKQEAKAVAAAEREKAARLKEEQERKYAQAVADFVKYDFLALTSVEGQGRFGDPGDDQLDKDATLRQLLDRAADKLETRTDLAPRIEAELRWIIGVSYRAIGEPERAIHFLKRSMGMYRDFDGEDGDATLRVRGSLASAYIEAQQPDLLVPLAQKTLELHKAKFGEDHFETLHSMSCLATGYLLLPRPDLALPILEQTLPRMRKTLGDDHPNTLETMNNLASGYRLAGKHDLSVPLFEELLRLQRARDHDSPTTIWAMQNVAQGYYDAGRHELALPLFEECLRLARAKVGEDFPRTLDCMNNLAACHNAMGNVEQATALYEETLRRKRKRLGEDHASTLSTVGNLSAAYFNSGQVDRALALEEEHLKIKRAKLGNDHPHTLRVMSNLARGYFAAQKLDQSLQMYEELMRHCAASLGDEHPQTLSFAKTVQFMTSLLTAESRYREKLAEFGPDHIDTLLARRDMAQACISMDQLDEAERLLVEVLHGMNAQKAEPDVILFTIRLIGQCLAKRQQRQPDDWTTFHTQSLLGGALLSQKRYPQAEPLLLAGYQGMKDRKDTIPASNQVRLAEAIDRLIELYSALDKADEVTRWNEERAQYASEPPSSPSEPTKP